MTLPMMLPLFLSRPAGPLRLPDEAFRGSPARLLPTPEFALDAAPCDVLAHIGEALCPARTCRGFQGRTTRYTAKAGPASNGWSQSGAVSACRRAHRLWLRAGSSKPSGGRGPQTAT
jgi:hypothetical protein